MNTANYTPAKEYFDKEYGKAHIQLVVRLQDFESLYGLMEEYAAYRAQEATEKAYEKGFKDGVNESAPDGFVFTLKAEYDKAWNAALDAASRIIDGWPSQIMTISEQQEEILNLKK